VYKVQIGTGFSAHRIDLNIVTNISHVSLLEPPGSMQLSSIPSSPASTPSVFVVFFVLFQYLLILSLPPPPSHSPSTWSASISFTPQPSSSHTGTYTDSRRVSNPAGTSHSTIKSFTPSLSPNIPQTAHSPEPLYPFEKHSCRSIPQTMPHQA